MATLELLNSLDHAALRLGAPRLGDRHFVQIVASEFATAAAYSPIVLTKHPETGRFYAGAMFGFKPGENLLRDDHPAATGFCPLDIVREGFFVSGDQIAIDVDHPRFASGDAMFDNGEPSEGLRQIQHAIGQFKRGLDETEAFIDTLTAARLIEPIDVSLRFDDGERIALQGIYTVSLDALYELDDATALALFRNGALQLVYTMIGSLKQIAALAARRNRMLTAAA